MIGPAVFAILSAYPAITAIAGSRITASIIPQDQPVPCLYYGTDNVKPIPVRDPMGCFSGTLEVGFETDTYTDLDALTTAIRGALDNYSGTVADTFLIVNRGESTPDDYDNTLKHHIRALSFQVSGGKLTT